MQLRDMEEMLNKILDSTRKDYMREALSCYHVGANRACIVLSVIAMVDDLYEKVKALSAINRDALDILRDIDAKKVAQQTFEQDLIDQLCSKGLLSKLDATISTQLKTLRHKAAHPSGHIASAEEARYVFSAVIDNILSKELKHTMQLVDDIMSTLASNGNYFPEYRMERTTYIASQAIAHLHQDAYSPLIKKLFEKAVNEKHSNSFVFILSLRDYDNEIFQEKLAKEIVNYASNDESFLLIPNVFTLNNKLVTRLKNDIITLARVNSLCFKLQNILDFSIYPSLMYSARNRFFSKNASLINELNLFTTFETSLLNYIEKYKYDIEIEIWNMPQVKDILLNLYNDELKSNSYSTSNFIANKLKDGILNEINISPEEAFKICESLEFGSNNGSFSCSGIVSNFYNNIPNIKARAKEYIVANPSLISSVVNRLNLEVSVNHSVSNED